MNPFLGLNPFDIVKQFTGGEEEVVEEGIEVMPSQFSNLQPPEQKPIREEEDYSAYIDHIKEKEGRRNKAYKPTTKENEPWTIGYGHTGEDVTEDTEWSDAQVDESLIIDIKKRLPAVREQIPNFDSLPEELRVPMLGSWFRGGLSGSPLTKKLIADGKFELAAEEFLDNKEYRESKTEKGFNKGMRGIGTRMEELADALRKYGKSQGSAKGGRVERNPDNNYNTQRMI